MDTYQRVHTSIQDHVALLEIDHPPVNTFDTPTFKDLNDALDQALADRQVKVIVITGTGKSFIAGADVNELAALSSVQETQEKAAVGHVLFDKIWRSPKPVIAAINGRYCLGGASPRSSWASFPAGEGRSGCPAWWGWEGRSR
jgi:enoyl-CoA hydratase/carnithine racemase